MSSPHSMSENSQAFVNMVKSMFVKSNPIEAMQAQLMMIIDTVMNLQSHRKLVKFRYALYKQQLNGLERNLQAGQVSQDGRQLNRLR